MNADNNGVFWRKFPLWWGVIPVLLLSLGLALPHYLEDAVWFDEAYTHLYSGTGLVPSMPLTDSLYLIAKTDPWPPGYYLLNIAGGRMIGRAEFSQYLLPSLIGLIAIAVTFRLVSTMYDKRSGLTAAFLLATSAFFIHYSHENRAYTLFVLVIALVFWFYWMILTRMNYHRRWLRWGFSLSIAMALYTHYVAGAFLIGLMVYHLLFEHPSRSNQPWMSPKRFTDTIRLWLNGCILFSPWFAMLLATLATESGEDRALPFFSLMGYAIYGFTNNLYLIFGIVLLASLLFWKMPQIRFALTILIASLIVVIIINMAVSFLFHPRHILPYLLILIVLMIPVLNQLELRFQGLATILIGLYAGAGIALSFTPDFMYAIESHVRPAPLQAIHVMQETIETCVDLEDGIIFSIDDIEDEAIQEVALQYYFLRTTGSYTQLGALTSEYEESTGEWHTSSKSDVATRIMDYTTDKANIWLMAVPGLDNRQQLMLLDDSLQEQGYLACPYESTGADIIAYSRDDSVCNTSCP